MARRVSGGARLFKAERLVHRGRRNDIHDTAATFFTSIRKDGEELTGQGSGLKTSVNESNKSCDTGTQTRKAFSLSSKYLL